MFLGYLIVTLCVTIIGVIGNSMVLAALFVNKKLLVLKNIFIANLAVADLLVAGIIHPYTAFAITRRTYFYGVSNYDPTRLCTFLASFCVISCSASVLSITAIAVNRYVYICHNHIYRKFFFRGSMIGITISIWILGVIVDMPNFIGLGRHVFHAKQITCFFDTEHFGYKLYFVFIGMVLPLGLTFICYVFIVKLVVRNKRRIRDQVETTRNVNIKPADVKLLKTVAIIGMLGVILYTPFTLTLLLDNGQIPDRVWMFSTGLMHSYSCINWAVYGMTNKTFRDAYIAIGRRYLSCGLIKSNDEDLSLARSVANSAGRTGETA